MGPEELSTVLPAVGDTPALIVWFAAAIVIPALVDLVANRLASPRIKASIQLVLTLITGVLSGFLTAHNAGVDYDWKAAIWGAGVTWFLSDKAFRFGKNADIFGQQGIIATAVPGGLGTPVIVDTTETVIVERGPDESVKGPETRLV